MSSLALSPGGNHLAVWEGPLEVRALPFERPASLIRLALQYKLYIISLNGDLLGSFTPDHDPGFGIRGVAWHPTGMFLAVGGWDDKVKIWSI